MKPLTMGLVAAVAVVACDSHSPTAVVGPSATVAGSGPTPSPPLPPLATYTVTGLVVDRDGAPVPAADLRSQSDETTSDAGGFYTLTVQRRYAFTSIEFSKSGYEPSVHTVGPNGNGVTTRNLRVYRIVTITAGDSIELGIEPGDPPCGLEEEWLCRRVRVRAGSPGTLVADVRSGASAQVTLVIGPISYPYIPATRLTRDIPAPTEIAIDILAWWTIRERVAFMLTTSLQPRLMARH